MLSFDTNKAILEAWKKGYLPAACLSADRAGRDVGQDAGSLKRGQANFSIWFPN